MRICDAEIKIVSCEYQKNKAVCNIYVGVGWWFTGNVQGWGWPDLITMRIRHHDPEG